MELFFYGLMFLLPTLLIVGLFLNKHEKENSKDPPPRNNSSEEIKQELKEYKERVEILEAEHEEYKTIHLEDMVAERRRREEEQERIKELEAECNRFKVDQERLKEIEAEQREAEQRRKEEERRKKEERRKEEQKRLKEEQKRLKELEEERERLEELRLRYISWEDKREAVEVIPRKEHSSFNTVENNLRTARKKSRPYNVIIASCISDRSYCEYKPVYHRIINNNECACDSFDGSNWPFRVISFNEARSIEPYYNYSRTKLTPCEKCFPFGVESYIEQAKYTEDTSCCKPKVIIEEDDDSLDDFF